ncbi:MAG: carbon-nitrogen hydrolase family protein [Candidatus Hodarchaeota archaeon]
MRVACIQPQIFQERNKCYLEIEILLKRLLEKSHKYDIVCLPERWVPYFKNPVKNIQKERGNDYNFIKNLAKEYNIKILSGGIWEKRNNLKNPTITCYFFDENGDEIGRQEKIHLYAYEQEQFEPGNTLKIFTINQYNFAILICFDMAFFETPRLAVENGANILFSPTQIREDGMSNWEIYLKARALENRVPVVACNSFGSYLKRKFIGNSKIISFHKGSISPSKLKIVEGPINSSGVISDDIDLSFPNKMRKIRLGEKVDKNKINVKIINN